MDSNVSLPLIRESFNPLTTGGVILTYGMQSAYVRPKSTRWKLVSRVDADPLESVRSSRAVWSDEKKRASLAVQIAEYDSAAAAAEGLATSLTKNQLPELEHGPSDLGEVSFVQPATVGPAVYFLRANLALLVTATGLSHEETLALAAGVDATIVLWPQKPGKPQFAIDIDTTSDPRTFEIQFRPPQPVPPRFYKFFAGAASLELRRTSVFATLLPELDETQLRVFDINGDDPADATATPIYTLPHDSRIGG